MSGPWPRRTDPDHDPDRTAVRRSAIRIGWQVAAVSAGLVVLIIGLVLAFVLWQSTPREELEQHAENATRIFVDSDELVVALAVIGAGAVLLAGVATWVIARRAVVPIGEALRLQRTFVADASHELRTPLTVMDARVQQLSRKTAADDPNREVVDALRDDTRALVDIVNDLLQAATSTDDGETSSTRVGVELDAAISDLQVLAGDHGIRIEHAPTDASVTVPAVPLRRCIVALVDNAVGHAPADSVVQVGVRERGRWVDISVTDHGGGIRGVDPSRVFDRFAHGTPNVGAAPTPAAQSTSAPTSTPGGAPVRRTGYGIGLALVREIAVRHGGAVRVQETGPAGTTFLLTLPSAR